jgi:hypothetical protein
MVAGTNVGKVKIVLLFSKNPNIRNTPPNRINAVLKDTLDKWENDIPQKTDRFANGSSLD